jgi:putative peptidoglycan lipid II flippase
MICQSILKSLTAPLLVFLGYGALGAVLGFTLSFLITGIISLTLLYLVLFKNLKKSNPKKPEIFKTLKTLLHYGVPLSISSIIAGFRLQFYNFMMAAFNSNTMIGNYQIATNFAILLTFTFPIATVMFPAFAKLDPKNEPQVLQTVFASSVKYTAFFLIPATIAVMVLSKPMISTIFGEKWIHALFFLTLYVINNLFVLFGGLIMWSLLAGIGETKMLMKLSLLTLGIGIPLAFILIPTFGIIGVILRLLLAGIPSLIWGLHWTWKRYKAKATSNLQQKSLQHPLIAAAITYLSISLL